MPYLVEVKNPDGSATLIALSTPGEDVMAVSAISDKALEAVQKISVGFDKVLESVVGMGISLNAAIADKPIQQATLEAGLQFTAKGNVYVVESTAQAAVTVSLTVCN